MIRKSIFLFIAFIISIPSARSQESAYKKNAVAFNLGRFAVNEINISLERFISARRSIEINGGLIYVNEGLVDFSKDWTNTHYFNEHGGAARLIYKIYKRPVDGSKWRDYIAPGISYKYLYYKAQWFENELSDSKGSYHERIFQRRFRNKFGLEFMWGKIYDMNRTFAFEFYYGVGINGTIAQRTDILKEPDDRVTPSKIHYINFKADNFYVRPVILAGVKLRLSF